MITPENIISKNEKYHSLKNMVLICELMEEFANAKLDEAIKIASDITVDHEDVGLKIQMLKSLK